MSSTTIREIFVNGLENDEGSHVSPGQSSQMVPNQETMEGDLPVQSHSHAQQPLQS